MNLEYNFFKQMLEEDFKIENKNIIDNNEKKFIKNFNDERNNYKENIKKFNFFF